MESPGDIGLPSADKGYEYGVSHPPQPAQALKNKEKTPKKKSVAKQGCDDPKPRVTRGK